MSKSSKGNYYKKKSKEFLEREGYQCEYLEKYLRYFNPRTKSVGFVKQDLFASDIVAMNEDEIIFVNSVLGKTNIASHIKEFKRYKWPPKPFVQQWIMVWQTRVREPEVIVL